MTGFSQSALFFPSGLDVADVRGLITGQIALLFDVLAFDQPGEVLTRSLAVPHIAGMDGIEVARAALRLRGNNHRISTDDFSVTLPTEADIGVAVSFPRPERVKKLFLSPPVFPDAVLSDARNFNLFGRRLGTQSGGADTPLRLVVRLAGPDGAFGPPVYAVPPFALESPLYDPVLSGAAFSERDDGGMTVALPGLPVPGLVLQIAYGDSADKLTPVNFEASVEQVDIDALCEGVRVSVDATDRPVTLFEHGPPLAPEAEARLIEFLPLATRLLSDALESDSTEATLSLPLSFHSETRGRIAILESALEARFRLDAHRNAPADIVFSGAWQATAFEAAAQRVPAETRMTIRARLSGRRINSGTMRPSPMRPETGMLVSGSTEVAAPVNAVGSGSDPQPIVAVSLCLSSDSETEISVSLRADAAGLPGEVIGAPGVVQLQAGKPNWVLIELPEPLAIAPGSTPLWISARATLGVVRWFRQAPSAQAATNDLPEPQITRNGGQSWSVPGGPLSVAPPLTAALIESVPDPQPAPQILGHLDETEWPFAAASAWTRLTDREFSMTGTFPGPLISALSNQTGGERISSPVDLFSTDFLTLTIDEMALFYDPTAAPGQQSGSGVVA